MNRRLKQILLLTLAVTLLAGSGRLQNAMNLDRERLGFTRMSPLENAPPMLAFTTVALGGFRGLISNVLWIRANDLQEQDKFFEMVQLSDWITKLEPHMAQVWVEEAWNMSYNISVKFKDFSDRWNWVRRGIELLRDEGLRYNPNAVIIYRELAWDYQHKMGADLDDANFYYKQSWFQEMSEVLDGPHPNFEALIHPKTEAERARARTLTDKFKIDPVFMQKVDDTYGPLEWRLPEAHAIYWAALGLEKARENPTHVNPDDLIQLRRVIYQSMQIVVVRGHAITSPDGKQLVDLGPNLECIRRANDAYEKAMVDDVANRSNIATGYNNFLRSAVYYLYIDNREKEAAQWYTYLQKQFPDKLLIGTDTNSLPGKMPLDEYVFARVADQVTDTSRDKTKLFLEAAISKSLFNLALGDEDRAFQMKRLAEKEWTYYQDKTSGTGQRIVIPPLAEIQQEVLKRMLDPERGLPPQLAAQLRARLNLPPPSTNAPPAAAAEKKL